MIKRFFSPISKIGGISVLGLLMDKSESNLHNLSTEASNVFDVFSVSTVHALGTSSGSCTSSMGSESGGGGGDPGNTMWSTPFLCTWNGERFEFENDVLFGKPTSFFTHLPSGRRAYEQGKVGADLYKIENKVQKKKNKLVFQIKEVEPEESYIDHLSLLHVRYPKDTELIVDGNYNRYWVFEKEALIRKEGIANQKISLEGADITNEVGSSDKLYCTRKSRGRFIERRQAIEIQAKVEDMSRPLFLTMRSRYRDYTVGQIAKLEELLAKKPLTLSRLLYVSPQVAVRGFVVLVLTAAMWVPGIGSIVNRDGKTLESDVRMSTAFADTGGGDPQCETTTKSGGTTCDSSGGGSKGGSFHISYWDWEKEQFVLIHVLEPRYYQYATEAVSIPKQAINASGEVRAQVYATKRHNLGFLSLIAPEKHVDTTSSEHKVGRAFHHRTGKDYKEVLNKKYSGRYMHTIPGDVIDIEFKTSEATILSVKEKETYLIYAGGFYGPASIESQRLAGNWVDRLDSEAYEWLKEMYSLKDYHKSDRTPVLS